MSAPPLILRRAATTRDARTATAAARLFLVLEGATFLVAAAIHAGALLDGHTHHEAAIAETVIASVLIAALGLQWTPQPWPLRFALIAQTFAVAGVLVGLFTIAIGVGPRTVPDVAYHVAILGVLAAGLAVCRTPTRSTPRRRAPAARPPRRLAN